MNMQTQRRIVQALRFTAIHLLCGRMAPCHPADLTTILCLLCNTAHASPVFLTWPSARSDRSTAGRQAYQAPVPHTYKHTHARTEPPVVSHVALAGDSSLTPSHKRMSSASFEPPTFSSFSSSPSNRFASWLSPLACGAMVVTREGV
jgi:hypothetical protein